MRAFIETERVEIISFGSVDETLARSYGEGGRTLNWRRSATGDYYHATRHERGVRCRPTERANGSSRR